MITTQEYQRINPDWKPGAFSIKGNPANKIFITEFKEAHGFKNEGMALDYLIQVAQATLADKTSPTTLHELEKELTESRQAYTTLQKDFYAAVEELAEMSDKIKIRVPAELFEVLPGIPTDIKIESVYDFLCLVTGQIKTLKESATTETVLNHPDFQNLKKSLIQNLPALLANVPGYNKDVILLTDNDVLEFLLEYCAADGHAKHRAITEANNPALLFPFVETAIKIAQKHGVIKLDTKEA